MRVKLTKKSLLCVVIIKRKFAFIQAAFCVDAVFCFTV